MGDELLIDVGEAANRLAVCQRTVRQMIFEGVLPSVKIGRSRRIAVRDLVQYVDRLRVTSSAPDVWAAYANDWRSATVAATAHGAGHVPEKTRTPSVELDALNGGSSSASTPR